MNRIRRTTSQIIDLAELVLKSMFLIVIVVLVAKELIKILVGESLATYIS